VKKWLVDIGDKVTAGQLMAEIETPDVAAQLLQARAQLLQAQAAVKQTIAQRDYSKANAARTVSLADQKLVSQSTVEQTQAQAGTDAANVAAAEANVNAQEANVRRLVELEGFSKVTAPFAGVVTQRQIERGALVGAGTTTDQSPLYTLVAIDPIRVFVDVPQTVAPSVKAGNDAAITVREFPGRTFAGKITRAAGALDPDLHTMSTEIQLPNADGALMPGMYVAAALTLPVPHRVLELPATALYNDSSGLRVATVDAHDHIKYVPITIERDNGATLWIATGLTGDERIVKIAVPSLLDGDPVDVPKTEVTKAETPPAK
jgi:RND family efflux transporter MFP subunit